MAEYLLFANGRYALPILQPLADALQASGHGVSAWLVDGAAGARLSGPVRNVGLREAMALRPRAVFSEFVVQHKPVVTFRNRAPKPHMLDFDDASKLPKLLEQAFAPTDALRSALVDYADAIHPYRDNRASERVIAATDDLIAGKLGTLRSKPVGSRFRSLQIRLKLGYWGFG